MKRGLGRLAAWAGPLVVVALVAGIGGYSVSEAKRAWGGGMRSEEVPAYDYFLRESSFSEVANARDTLQASASQLVVRLQQDGVAVARRSGEPNEGLGPKLRGDLGRVVSGLRSGIEEFRGTEQELFLIQHLLWTLHAKESSDEWLGVYLDILYRHPAADVVARNAAQALRIAGDSGALERLEQAIRFLESSPVDFSAKREFGRLRGRAAPSELRVNETSLATTRPPVVVP
jgi:hypothetical protein